ncbi:sigma-70 region 4 domain-containing protein [Streptomyces sp. RS10V-4]|uniref:sigma-70 region 4 domain-containing protein n=1 Tax=Streptomyces rhizoryzae TaxID=2932493 RepID=UPI00200641C6|nr:sigma-70 region 4 domain-containing protein [Streptomyces rhizoryzae]MCK7627779.1 sigma-70 region 4 domain-containing protein [Streptomyces rhizoryzae]
MAPLRARFGMSSWALYRLLRRHRVPLRGRDVRNSASGRAAAAYERLRADGMTHEEVAEKFGIKCGTLDQALRRRSG